jgi:hypothetical protein
VLKYWHTDALPRHPAPVPPSAELARNTTTTSSSSSISSYHNNDEDYDDADHNDVVSDVTASTAAAERDALSEAGSCRRGSWLDMLDLRTVLRVDKRDAAAAEAAETSRGVLCHGELSLDHLHRCAANGFLFTFSELLLCLRTLAQYRTPRYWIVDQDTHALCSSTAIVCVSMCATSSTYTIVACDACCSHCMLLYTATNRNTNHVTDLQPYRITLFLFTQTTEQELRRPRRRAATVS